MRTIYFANRNFKEILRDPITIIFGAGFPLVLLLLLSAIQANIPVELFKIESLAPGICVFGLSFVTLFSATLISKDRSSAFFQRLYSTPLTALDFMLGYTLPLLPISLCQTIICFIASICLGLNVSVNILYSIIFMLPIYLLYIALGLLCGSILNDKQVGGICGALLTNLTAFLSGVWFDLELVGGVFKKIAYLLPFAHAVDMQRELLAGSIQNAMPHFLWVVGYAIILLLAAVLVFLRQMKNQ